MYKRRAVGSPALIWNQTRHSACLTRVGQVLSSVFTRGLTCLTVSMRGEALPELNLLDECLR